MFRKYLYEVIGDDHIKESEMHREYECYKEESDQISKAAFCAGFDAALAWVEEIIMKRTTEQKMEAEHRR